jgi:hypothetical protein
LQGPAGAKGDTGATGAAGSPGVTGAKGDTGLTGLQGSAGAKGDAGVAGPAGSPGAAGAKGDPGTAGTNGTNGAVGATGPAGPAPSGTGIVTVSSGTLQTPGALTGDVTTTGAGLATTIGAGKVTNDMLSGSIAASKLVGTDITTVGTITAGIWNGGTIAIARGGTGSTTQNFVDLTTNQTIDGAKQFQKAATNTAAISTASNTIDFSQSNLATTSFGGNSPSYTLNNFKNGGAYTLVLTSTSNTGEAAFTATTPGVTLTIKKMGTNALTSGKAHIYSFIVVGTVIYVSMATEN